jgi:hypothetical protein
MNLTQAYCRTCRAVIYHDTVSVATCVQPNYHIAPQRNIEYTI